MKLTTNKDLRSEMNVDNFNQQNSPKHRLIVLVDLGEMTIVVLPAGPHCRGQALKVATPRVHFLFQ